jgi:dihydrofolate reductase
MTDIALIAALDRDRAIGVDNRLPWSLPDDLRRFKTLTLGHAVLMGRKTAESIGRALPGRMNLVLTRTGRAPLPGMSAVATLDEAMAAATGPLFVIGGGDIYGLALPRATRMHLTHVDVALPRSDTWFPAFDPAQWRIERRERHGIDARHAHAFEFIDYLRISG